MDDVNQHEGRKHIFAINSTPEFLEIIRELLEDEHFAVTTTNYVPQTFDQIAALQPNLLLLDLVVYEKAGWDLLERLNHDAITRDIPVLVTSTDPRLLARMEGNEASYGQHRFMAKPLDIHNLLRTIHELVGLATRR